MIKNSFNVIIGLHISRVNDLEVYMSSHDDLNLGDEIKNIVQDALNSKNFNKLNHDVGNVVKGALNEVKKSIDKKPRDSNDWDNQTYKNNYNSINNTKNAVNNKGTVSLKTAKFTAPVGQVSSILFTVFGSIGSIGFGIAVFVLTLLGFSLGKLPHTIAIGLFPLFILSVFLLVKGISSRKRLKRFQRYLLYMRGQSYCLISDLASATGLSNKSVYKDLRKMIAIGMFPEGHIDNKKTTFMLTNECYDQYLELERRIKIDAFTQTVKDKYKTDPQDFKVEEKKNQDLDPEIRRSLDEGRKFVLDIKAANIEIPGQEISLKLDRLEEVTGKIFDYIEIYPEKFTEIRKFTEYFLPTTLKLLYAYKKLDYQSIQGENILNAKKEIEDTMDTINLAFENLLDDLFGDLAMDISTDISVLETMFAQEGLTGNGMKFKK